MSSRILLLIILNSCLCAATFRVNVAQSCYQAEENHSITLEWTFTTTPHGSSRELFIDCSLLVPPRELILYQVLEGVEVPESQDEEFSGRVQTDKDVLREGRIRLHVSRLRTEDSGLYICEVMTEDGSGIESCRLNVSGPNFDKIRTTETVPHRKLITPTPQEETIRNGHRSRLFLLFPVIVFIVSLSSLFIYSLKKCCKNTEFQKNLLSRASALQLGCLAQGQTCVDVEGSSISSSLLQHRHGNPPGANLVDQSEVNR